MESNTTSKKLTLKSSDGEEFLVDEEAAKLSKLICPFIEARNTTETIPILKVDDGLTTNVKAISIPKVTGRVLAKVIEYCNKHAQADGALKCCREMKKLDDEMEKWDKAFVNVDQVMLFHLMTAANYLLIDGLVDLTCQKVASMMNGKSLEDVRETFNIRYDLSAEEEKEINQENSWAIY